MTLSVNGDVWKFETGDQDWASDDLNNLFSNATNQTKGSLNTFGNRMKIIKYLRTLWDGESWESIRRKAEAEGSTWYVWYMDGLNKHLRNLKQWEMEDEANEIIAESKTFKDTEINLRAGEIAVILRALRSQEEKAHSQVLRTATKDLIYRIEEL